MFAEQRPENEPTLADIRAAAVRIRPFIRRTPVLSDERLSQELGAQVVFKCENLQLGGAFKLRGATNAVQLLDAQSAMRGVATHSSGNHGAALARAARQRGIPAWVVMPRNASAGKLEAVRAQGAELILCEPGHSARDAALSQLLATRELETVHPYDDVRVICGQGTAALELLEDEPDLDVIIAPVSGGGLLGGIAIAAKAIRPRIKVFGTEPALADDAYRSFYAGQHVTVDAPDTIADGLRGSLSVRNFERIRRLVDGIALASEEAIKRAVVLVLDRMKLLIEPSAAVPVAALFERSIELQGARVGIVLSGGNVDLDSPWLIELLRK